MPNIVNIFDQDAYSSVWLTNGINKSPFLPTFVTGQNLFRAEGVPTTKVALEVRKPKYSILDLMPRGGVPPEEVLVGPKLHEVQSYAIGDAFTVTADQLQDVTARAGDDAAVAVQNIVAEGMAQIRASIEATFEHMYLRTITTGSWSLKTNTIENWYTYWTQSAPAETDFALTTTTTDVRGKCEAIRRAMVIASEGLIGQNAEIHALASDGFYDALRSHTAVKETYLGYSAAADLRQQSVWSSFPFGGITFHNYRGTNDGTSIGLTADKAYFYPVGTDIFRVFYAPHPAFDTVNSVGLPLYTIQLPDPSGRNMFRRFEVYSYPVIACMQPSVLFSARKA